MSEHTTNATALAGLKVLDLSWALVAPAAMRVLADFGATVVKVESSTRIDPVRAGPPYWRNQPGPERSSNFINYNVNKRMIQLDLSQQAARDVVLRLVDWCDIAIESFVPGVMERWNLHYDALRQRKPDLIMVSTCLNGQTGPDRAGGGYGVGGAARAAMIEVLGWPDRDPSLARAYTDYTASRMVAVATLAALDHRRRTGQGQYVDLSQVEASIPFIGAAVLDASVNGRELRRRGNRQPGAVPHGVFPCAGDDCWIAIAVRSQEEWRALCGVAAPAGRATPASRPRTTANAMRTRWRRRSPPGPARRMRTRWSGICRPPASRRTPSSTAWRATRTRNSRRCSTSWRSSRPTSA